ncbi:hypothetical protein MJG53_009175 [Ovis ammon polii x Ovis aries]|uniref:Uncharacterized protein n=1 Tax=Ovis ammon polii x Ovis aries TaxID=2918886 RepID=A0ACB9UZ33_9CETA|nr:hypothetical protein MJG53_009175 [Ovis ammon polii x Ovis aries]
MKHRVRMGPVPLPLSQASCGRCRRHQYWAFLLGFRGVTVAFKKERGFQSRVCPARGGPSRKSALVPRAVLAPEQEVRQLKLFTQVLSRLRRAPH